MRGWRRICIWLLKDWQGCVFTLGDFEISEGWQVERIWLSARRERGVDMGRIIPGSVTQHVA